MNLLQIRTQFVKLSGRYDLSGTAFVDNGADYFIKAGIKLLDRLAEFEKDLGVFFKQVAADGYYVEVASDRTIERVWWADGVNGRYELGYLNPTEFQKLYGTAPYTDYASSAPWNYTKAIVRASPDSTPDVSGTDYDEYIKVDGTQLSKIVLLFGPPTQYAGQLEVWGKYSTPWPSSDTGTNFWFESFDHLAVNAALYQLEVSYRNTQGAADWLASIKLELEGIEKDLVETEAANADQMEG